MPEETEYVNSPAPDVKVVGLSVSGPTRFTSKPEIEYCAPGEKVKESLRVDASELLIWKLAFTTFPFGSVLKSIVMIDPREILLDGTEPKSAP